MRYDLYNDKVRVDGKEINGELPPIPEIIRIVRNSSGYLFGLAAAYEGSIFCLHINPATKELWLDWGNYFLNTFSVPVEWRKKVNVLWSARYKSGKPIFLGHAHPFNTPDIYTLSQFAVLLKQEKSS